MTCTCNDTRPHYVRKNTRTHVYLWSKTDSHVSDTLRFINKIYVQTDVRIELRPNNQVNKTITLQHYAGKRDPAVMYSAYTASRGIKWLDVFPDRYLQISDRADVNAHNFNFPCKRLFIFQNKPFSASNFLYFEKMNQKTFPTS